MPRLRYGPQLVYKTTAADEAILSKQGQNVVIYTDEAGTVLANILDADGVAVAGSTLVASAGSQLPEFYGPTGDVAVLWAKPTGTSATVRLTPQGELSGRILDSAEIVANVNTTSTTPAQLTGLTCDFEVIDGRSVEVVFSGNSQISVADRTHIIEARVDGTKVAQAFCTNGTAGGYMPVHRGKPLTALTDGAHQLTIWHYLLTTSGSPTGTAAASSDTPFCAYVREG